MDKIILFTPVGGTDPISSTNCRDGSMLHICRNYKPDKVIMYMSKEMLENQETDDRYRYCLDRLSKLQQHEIKYKIVERRELTEVHEFDYFYEDFREIIRQIYEEMDETDTLMINVSSGTPAMKSGLLVLQTLGEFPAKMIQVATPERKINEHIHKNYDVELLWELNEDNEDGSLNRCREIKCPTLSKIKKEEIIKKHILAYDYSAALEVTDTMQKDEVESYRDLLYMASQRMMLDFENVDKMIRKTGIQCLPVRGSGERKYFEYACNMEIRLKKKEYVDFIRSVTPLIVDLFELILKKRCHVKIDDYCRFSTRDGKGHRRWSMQRLKDTTVLKILNDGFDGNFNGQDISSEHLKVLIESLDTDQHLIELVRAVRSVEDNVRNLAAHQIISVTEEKIQKLTGFSSDKIMEMIKELFNYTGINIKKEYWDSYDEMNKIIISKM
ncbi:type III-A CRISPR-associated CARF protein Csm6 [uncultured Eubacterium sp.]|uniref:type III-A CRISPR-associated CARF protein Csm6 n=1 Tax=uncultured Eubacterium sp. TaxID=165185 RepID=UPI002597D7CF|nr:CRISPR-associated protein Csm6 [uncultured Eubacterium sp.]